MSGVKSLSDASLPPFRLVIYARKMTGMCRFAIRRDIHDSLRALIRMSFTDRHGVRPMELDMPIMPSARLVTATIWMRATPKPLGPACRCVRPMRSLPSAFRRGDMIPSNRAITMILTTPERASRFRGKCN